MNVKITFTAWNVIVWESIYFGIISHVISKFSSASFWWMNKLCLKILTHAIAYAKLKNGFSTWESHRNLAILVPLSLGAQKVTKWKLFLRVKILFWLEKMKKSEKFLKFGSIFFLLFWMGDKNVPILVSSAFRFNSI